MKNNKISRYLIVLLILILPSRIAFSQDVVLRPQGQVSDQTEENRQSILRWISSIQDPELVNKLYDFYIVQWAILHGYVDEKSSVEIMNLAMTGMVNGLDPYSNLFIGDNAESIGKKLTGEDDFVGVGMTIMNFYKNIVIMEVFDNSPAAKSGLEPGDVISKVNGESIFGMTTQKIVSLIRGTEGTSVVLEIKAARFQKPKEVTVVRHRVTVESVSYKDLKGGYAYVKIRSFVPGKSDTPGTAERFRKALQRSSGKKGLIIDLRDNGGGATAAVNEMVGFLVGFGKTLVTFEGRNVHEEVFTFSEKLTNLPSKIVVLVNNFSASASEIMAGNLKHYKVATIVGVRTYGKATAQNYSGLDGKALEESQLVLGLTIARYKLPNGEDITDNGVQPDVEVEQPENFRRFQYLTKKDRQFQTALRILKKK